MTRYYVTYKVIVGFDANKKDSKMFINGIQKNLGIFAGEKIKGFASKVKVDQIEELPF